MSALLLAALAAPYALQSAEPALGLELDGEPSVHGESSAFPSFFRGVSGQPFLVATRVEGERAWLCVEALPERSRLAPQPLHDGRGERGSRDVASGQDWFLNWADIPAVEQLADGTTLGVWLAKDPAHEQSYGTRFTLAPALGNEGSAPRPLEEHGGPGEHGFVSLAPLDGERFMAIWLDGRGMDAQGHGEMQLLARTVARDGRLGPETVVDPRACSCCPTALARLADGTLLAAWRDRSPAEVRDISLARSDGKTWCAPEPLHADGWRIEGCPVNGPRLAASPERVAAAWYTGADGSVRVAFGGPDGRGFGAPIRVDEGASEGRGDCAFLADGSLLVGWMEHDEGEVSWRARRVRPDGRLGPTLSVTPISSGRASGFLRMTTDGESALLAWTEPGDGGRCIRVQRVLPQR